MIDGVFNVILLFLASWRPSLIAYGYGLLGLMLWLVSLRKELIGRTPYILILVYSILSMTIKLIFEIMYVSNSSMSVFDDRSYFQLCGIYLSNSFDFNTVMNYYAEIIAVVIGIIGTARGNALNSNYNSFSRSFMGLIVMLNLLSTALSFYSLANALYFTYLMLWISFWGYRVNERFLQLGMTVVSLTTLIQILASPLCKIFNPGQNDLQEFIGIIYFRDVKIPCYISTFFLFLTSTTFVRRLIVRDLKYSFLGVDGDKLIRRETIDPKVSTFFERVMNYLSFTLVYGICMFNIFLWIANFLGYIQVAMAIWMFYSTLEKDSNRMMLVVTRKFFIPLILTDCGILYLYNLFNIALPVYIGHYWKDYSPFYVLFEVWTISMFYWLQRKYKKKNVDNNRASMNINIIIGVLLENSSRVALIVVFMIGLSKINLIHLGFMTIFLVFMLSYKISRKYWVVLVIYTQLVILAEYIFGIVIFSGVHVEETKTLEIIGLTSTEIDLIAAVFPKNYLTWILLLSASMQLSAYRSSYIKKARRETLQNVKQSKIIYFFSKLYTVVIYLIIWIVYIAIFIAIMMSSLNVINFIRLLLFVILFCVHVIQTKTTLADNLKTVEKNWNILVYYSGAVLVVRYCYQYFRYMKNFDFSSDFIGIQVYSDEKLYENMVTDCIILFVCVFQKNKMMTSGTKNASGQTLSTSEIFISVADVIKKTELKSEKWKKIKDIGSCYYCYVCYISIIAISIYNRISVSMLLYLFCLCVYAGSVERHIRSCINEKIEKNISKLGNYRIIIWKTMSVLTVIYILISFLSFAISDDITLNHNSNTEWAYFILGFSKAENGFLIIYNYQYLLVLLLLTIERYFIDEFIQNGMTDTTPKNQKANLVVKILIESFMPSFTLALSFSKLTVVSIVYSIVVFFTIKVQPLKRAQILFWLILMGGLTQYLTLLVNLSKYDSTYEVPKDSPNPPWERVYSDRDNDVLTFLNLGTEMKQTLGLFGDFAIIWVLLIFFSLYATAKSEIEQVFDRSSSLTKQQREKKEIIYTSAHFIILFLVLIFISESSGFFSLFYCAFSLICILVANRILRDTKAFQKYKKLLNIFLIILMSGELFVQTLFQMPIHGYFTETDEAWLNAIGLAQLWRAGGHEPTDVYQKYKRIYFKVFTLGLILIAIWLMNTEDYSHFVANLSKIYRVKAKKLGVELAQHFNNQRFKELKSHRENKERSRREMKLLEQNVQKWNQMFLERGSIRPGVNAKRESFKEEETFENIKDEYKPGFTRTMQNMLISSINPIIFKHFIFRIKQKKNEEILKENEEEKKKIKETEVGSGEVFQFEESSKRKELIEKLKKKQHAYILNYRDYLKIFLFIFSSCTQGIVFFFFFLNHLYYASFESLVYPLSVLCYALLSYPRPNPKYFKFMLIYTELIFFVKFVINLYIWEFFDEDYRDDAKTGINFAKNTYSKSLTNYVILDAMCLLSLLAHEYYLIRCGLHEHTEVEIETFEQAHQRRKANSEKKRSLTISLVGKTEKRPKPSFSERIKDFFVISQTIKPEEKPGHDYYTRAVMVQLAILIFLLFFFSQMIGATESFNSIFEANTFPGELVVALIFHIFIMFLERFIYIEVTSNNPKNTKGADRRESSPDLVPPIDDIKSIKFKFYFHLCLVIIVHLLVFWFFPLFSNYQKSAKLYCSEPYNKYNCNNFQINPALQIFYVLYLLYFIISSLQIKYGSPKTRAGEFVLMKTYNDPAQIAFIIYRGVPFLYEIRTLMDWTFTSTALKLSQWFKFEEIYASLYNTKVDQAELAEHYKDHKGEKLPKWEKILKGCCFLLAILICIMAPLIIFSSLNPIVYENPVRSIQLSIGIKSGTTNFYNLFSTTMITDKTSVSDSHWKDLDFDRADQLTINDRTLMKKFTMNTYSDNQWIMSSFQTNDMCVALKKNGNLHFQAEYSFTRDYPKSQQTVSKIVTESISDSEGENLFDLICVSDNNHTIFHKKDIFYKVVRLVSTGSNILPIIITGHKYKTDIYSSFRNDTEKIWRIGRNSKYDGIEIYVVSEKYSPVTFNFSVITFYISVVYLVGKILRIIISGGSNNIPLVDIPNPDPLINICSGIYVSRMNGDLITEEELYYELIDILRSPELIKLIGGSSSIKPKEE